MVAQGRWVFFFDASEDMVQKLLMLEVLFTQEFMVEDLFCGASSGSEPGLLFSKWGINLFKITPSMTLFE